MLISINPSARFSPGQTRPENPSKANTPRLIGVALSAGAKYSSEKTQTGQAAIEQLLALTQG